VTHRRTILALLANLLPALYFAGAGAQPSRTAHRIGVLAQDLQPGLLDTFRDELQKLGYVEGDNIEIEVRNAAGRNDRLAGLANELLRLNVVAIVAVNTPAAQAAKKATSAIPIIMMRVADPVKSGLVASFARPGGNVTGLSFMPDALGPKGVEMLREIVPNLSRMAALYQGDNTGAVVIVDEVERKGRQMGLTFLRVPVRDAKEYAAAFDSMVKIQAQALFVMDDGAITKRRQLILDLAAHHALPVVSIYKDFAEAGGLIAYGPDLDTVYRRGAYYVDRLIKGEAASQLPIEQPTNFHLAVNLRTARALGLTIPPTLLARADEVIE